MFLLYNSEWDDSVCITFISLTISPIVERAGGDQIWAGSKYLVCPSFPNPPMKFENRTYTIDTTSVSFIPGTLYGIHSWSHFDIFVNLPRTSLMWWGYDWRTGRGWEGTLNRPAASWRKWDFSSGWVTYTIVTSCVVSHKYFHRTRPLLFLCPHGATILFYCNY